MTDRDFYLERVSSWMSPEELRTECGKLQTADAAPPELLLIHAMHALEELQAEAKRLRTDGASAVRWAPGSAYWSEVLVELFGPDARKGIDVLERRWQAALERADKSAEALRELEGCERRDEALLRKGPHPAIAHCDNCGCDWPDNGLNPVGCPYCELSAGTEALRESLAALKAENEKLSEALRDGLHDLRRRAETSWQRGFQQGLEANRQQATQAMDALKKEREAHAETNRAMTDALLMMEERTQRDETLLRQALEALIWTTGSKDFGEGGLAREGALKLLFPTIAALRERLGVSNG